jgi:hypothetical protein
MMQWLEYFSSLPVRVEAILAVLSFLFGLWTYRRQQHRLIEVQKQQTYQRLELASNDLFRFTASNAEPLVHFQGTEKNPSYDPGAKDMMIADNHIYQTLNLFEMAARLRQANHFDDEVFGSWVIWYYETLTSWYFRLKWNEIRHNYTKEMRLVFDKPVAAFASYADDTVGKQQFFEHVADRLGCRQVRGWLKS